MILGWDLSTNAGWAIMESPTQLIDLGTKELQRPDDKMDFGTRQLELFYLFNQLCQRYPAIDAVAFEAPLTPIAAPAWKPGQKKRFRTSPYTIRLLHTLAATIELAARLRGIRPQEVAVISAKTALAHARADKAAMVEAAKKRFGLDAVTEHEADAIGVCLKCLQ